MPQRPVSELIAKQTVVTAEESLPVAKAAALMRDAKVGALLVVKGGKLAGIFTERDALYRVIAAGLDPAKTRLAEVMTADPESIPANRPFGHALHLMHERGFRHVPVVDNGRPVGMVSARDALGLELKEFEAELQDRDRITEILG